MSEWVTCEKCSDRTSFVNQNADICDKCFQAVQSEVERLKAELETAGIESYPLWLIKGDGTRLRIPEAKAADYLELQAELSKAQAKIKELEFEVESLNDSIDALRGANQ